MCILHGVTQSLHEIDNTNPIYYSLSSAQNRIFEKSDLSRLFRNSLRSPSYVTYPTSEVPPPIPDTRRAKCSFFFSLTI